MSRGTATEITRARIEYNRAAGLLDKRIRRLKSFSINALNDRILRVRCLAGLGRSAEATAEIERVLAESPNHPEGLLVAGVVHALAGRPDKAMVLLRQGREAGVSEERLRLEWPLASLMKEFGGR